MSSALSSLRVLDFSTLIPGPFATMVLADLGARVIRVEAPGRPDPLRDLPPGRAGEASAWHGVLGRSKRSIQLDLKNPRGREVVFRLIETHDVVVEQMRPGTMDRLGVGYEALRAANPAVIYCSINSFGSRGPWRDRAAHDVNALALAGVLATGGGWGDEAPCPCPWPLGIQVADLAAAMNAVAGILAAVLHRSQTGEGQRLETSLYTSALMWNLLAASGRLVAGAQSAAGSGLLDGGSRYGVYETADGRHLALGGLEAPIWERFCEAAGRPDLADEPLEPAEPELRARVAALIRERTLAEWTGLLAEVDACADPVLAVDEALDRARDVAPEMLVQVGEGDRAQQQVGNAIRLDGTPVAYRHPGPLPGANRDEILAELGYTAAEIEALGGAGAFG